MMLRPLRDVFVAAVVAVVARVVAVIGEIVVTRVIGSVAVVVVDASASEV